MKRIYKIPNTENYPWSLTVTRQAHGNVQIQETHKDGDMDSKPYIIIPEEYLEQVIVALALISIDNREGTK